MNILTAIYRNGFDILDQTQRKKGDNPEVVCDDCLLKERQAALRLTLLQLSETNSQFYGFTFTFKKKFHVEDPKTLHKILQQILLSSTTFGSRAPAKYYMFPEFSPTGNLHYHGVIYDCYQVQFIKMCKWWRRKYGFVKVEIEIKHPKKWVNYITKDYCKTGLWTIYKS